LDSDTHRAWSMHAMLWCSTRIGHEVFTDLDYVHEVALRAKMVGLEVIVLDLDIIRKEAVSVKLESD